MLEESPLDPAIHDRKSFDCGVPALNDYLQGLADQHRRKSISTSFVLTDSAAPTLILGYYSLSAAQVDVEQLGTVDQKKLPRYPIPCFRLARLAASRNHQGSGIGKLLLGCALDRCLKARKDVAAYALIVDAKDQAAQAFCQHFGFTTVRDAPLTLYLALGKQA